MYEHASAKSLAITDAVIVLPDRVIESGSVGVIDGRIVEVQEGNQLAHEYEESIDARGAYLMPGIIDLHNDSLETEVNPRPETNFPAEFALANLERRLLFSGVTTEFHAISFMNNARSNRTVGAAAERAARVAEYAASGRQLIDNNVLHRLDVWSPQSHDLIYESLDRMPFKYVSINDHTPGQGQYRDLTAYKDRMTAWVAQRGGKMDPSDAEKRMQERAADEETVPMVYARIMAERERSPFFIASHDDDSPEKVEALHDLGATVTEFPVTFEAAQRARDLGMTILVGAPNIVRGGSSSGNLDAEELFSRGLADVICADYHAPSILQSAFRLIDHDVIDLPQASRALSTNAAKALGRGDLGAIALGYVADLILVAREAKEMPCVEGVIRHGRRILDLRSARRVEVPA